MYNSLHIFKNSFNRYWLLGLVGLVVSLCYIPTGWGQEKSEIDELRALLQQTQEVMQQQQQQMEILQKRILELEEKTVETQEAQETIEETLLSQEMESAGDGSRYNENLSLHGYYDFLYLDATDSQSRSFILNELSLFLRGTTEDERWTFFSELEFELFDGDDFYFGGDAEESEFEVETAWLEYSFSDELQIRAGKLLLPQYWQTYHYPNITLSTRPPAMVGRIFPSNIIGLEAKGDWWFDDQQGISYVAYIGNGGDSEISEVDQNENKAVGGRLTTHFAGSGSLFDTLDFSVSGYSGQDHSNENETVFGLDTQIRIKKWEILSEFAWGDQQVEYKEIDESLVQLSTDTYGYYVQLGYNFKPRWHVFYRFDEMDLNDDGLTPWDSHQNTIGVNFRPRSNISLKFELFEADIDRIDDPFYGIASAIVYNF